MTTDSTLDPIWEHQQKCLETLNKSSSIQNGKLNFYIDIQL